MSDFSKSIDTVRRLQDRSFATQTELVEGLLLPASIVKKEPFKKVRLPGGKDADSETNSGLIASKRGFFRVRHFCVFFLLFSDSKPTL